MKVKIVIFIAILIAAVKLYGQFDTGLFSYEKAGTVTVIKPKKEVNRVLSKGMAILYYSSYHEKPWYDDAIVKPFQELIDSGVFSAKRMRELEKGDQTRIEVFFDETGIVSYVSFYYTEKTLLTEKELYTICQKYKGVLYDLTYAGVLKSETGSKTVFYCQETFTIPFEDLKY